MTKQELIEKIIKNTQGPYVGARPVSVAKYSTGELCETCGRPIANPLAWGKLSGGDGTNLCWDPYTCTMKHYELEFTKQEIDLIVECLDGK